MRNWSQVSLSEKLYWKVSKRIKFTEALETNIVGLTIFANITTKDDQVDLVKSELEKLMGTSKNLPKFATILTNSTNH